MPASSLHRPPAGSWTPLVRIGSTQVLVAGAILGWQSGLSIDADGDPRCYHPADWGPRKGRAPKGRDAPENAVARREDLRAASPEKVKRWAGVVVDGKGQPVVQGPQDPAPGFWVSTTALTHAGFAAWDPRHYVDSSTVPYLAVPPQVLRKSSARLGDLAAVEYEDRCAFAILADVGPTDEIGEGSPALARALGIPDDPRRGGTAAGLTTYLFCGSGDRRPLSLDAIHQRAKALYDSLRRSA